MMTILTTPGKVTAVLDGDGNLPRDGNYPRDGDHPRDCVCPTGGVKKAISSLLVVLLPFIKFL